MSRLAELIARCKAGVYVNANVHRDHCESVEKRLSDMREDDADMPEDSVIKEMTARDTMIELQFYPDTPIGSYTVIHYDIDAAVEEAHEILDSRSK